MMCSGYSHRQKTKAKGQAMIKKGKILIVDDNPSFRDAYSLILEMKGFEVLTAEDYPSAVALIEQHYFHAATIDVRLIDDDKNNEQGMEFIKKLKDVGEGTRGIISTAYPRSDRYKRAYKELDAFDFLDKGELETGRLVKAIEEAVEEAKSVREANVEDRLRLQRLAIGVSIPKFENQIGPRQSGGVRRVLRGLAKPLLPIDSSEQHQVIDKNGHYPTFETVYWSRYKGSAFKVKLGHIDQISDERESLEQQGITVSQTTLDKISGIRYPVDISYAEFQSKPEVQSGTASNPSP